MYVGDLGEEAAASEIGGVCRQGGDKRPGSDLIGTAHPLEVPFAVETRQMGSRPREAGKKGCRDGFSTRARELNMCKVP